MEFKQAQVHITTAKKTQTSGIKLDHIKVGFSANKYYLKFNLHSRFISVNDVLLSLQLLTKIHISAILAK